MKIKKSAAIPGDAVAVSPTANENGTVVGVADAGRLLHFSTSDHGKQIATYHSSRENKSMDAPASALERLEEGDDVDESEHPDLKIVPLRIGDAQHKGRSIIFHQGAAVGTVDPSRIGGKNVTTVSSGPMGEDRHFLDRNAAIKAIHDHFVQPTEEAPAVDPNAPVLEKETEKMLSIGDLAKGDQPRDADGKFATGDHVRRKNGGAGVPDNSVGKILGQTTLKGDSRTYHRVHWGSGFSGGKVKLHTDAQLKAASKEDYEKQPKAEKGMTIGDLAKAFSEEDHPRGKGGKFTSGSGRSYTSKPSADGKSNTVHDADGYQVGRVDHTKSEHHAWQGNPEIGERHVGFGKDHNEAVGKIVSSHEAMASDIAGGNDKWGTKAEQAAAPKPNKASDGKFTSSSGATYTHKKAANGNTHIHDADGNHIGHVGVLPDNMDGGDTHYPFLNGMHAATLGAEKAETSAGNPQALLNSVGKVVAAHEKNPKKNIANLKSLREQRLASEVKDKMTVADLLKAGTAHDPKTGQFTVGDYVKRKAHNVGAGDLGGRVGKITNSKMINGRPLHEVTWAAHNHHDSSNAVSPKDWKHENSLDPATKEEHDEQQKAKKEKSTLVADLLKAGTAHDPSTGQFTSGSGASYSAKKEAGTDRTHVHDAKGKKVGTIYAQKQNDGSTQHVGVHAAAFGKVVNGKSEKHAAKRLADLHESIPEHQGGAKAATIGDLAKSVRTIGDIAKSDISASTSLVRGPFVGSFEDTLRRIRGPVCMGSGCAYPPKYNEAGERDYSAMDAEYGPGSSPRKYPHYLDVMATFPDHAIVRCSDEDKAWKVPYEWDGDTVSTSEPEEVVAQFVPADEVDANGDEVDVDDEGDEDEEAA